MPARALVDDKNAIVPDGIPTREGILVPRDTWAPCSCRPTEFMVGNKHGSAGRGRGSGRGRGGSTFGV
jgi:hypothetical protein